MVRIEIDYDKLGDDKSILDVCPAGVFEEQGGKIVVAHADQCVVCRACEGAAPEGAITVIEE
ncbi:ferredoxin family protein [Candidatus Woesearchaeota archaeon]|nr:ferredoxin family protein [Candidatus Woesearchaeota archaeon]